MIQALERAGLSVTRALSAFGLFALLFLAGMTLVDGLARWLLNAPIEGVRDAGSLVIAVAVACLLPVGLAERSHITIRVAEPFLGATAAKWLDALAAMLVALLMLLAIWLLLTRTRIGLVIQAALTHPETVEALGHNVPRVFMMVFGGGCALAGLAGVIGGNAYVTEPSMAFSVGGVIFVVVVVGGMGSLAGAFLASLLIGILQTFAVAIDASIQSALEVIGVAITPSAFGYALWKLKISQIAPILPYLLLVLILIFRPKGLLGKREG